MFGFFDGLSAAKPFVFDGLAASKPFAFDGPAAAKPFAFEGAAAAKPFVPIRDWIGVLAAGGFARRAPVAVFTGADPLRPAWVEDGSEDGVTGDRKGRL
jgi:hypothetical protein